MIGREVGASLFLPGALGSLYTPVPLFSSADQFPWLAWCPQWLPTPCLQDLNSFSNIYFLSLCVSSSETFAGKILINGTKQPVDQLGISCSPCLNQLWPRLQDHRALLWPCTVSANEHRHACTRILCESSDWRFTQITSLSLTLFHKLLIPPPSSLFL